MASRKRVGIFGGSFDPVHIGHLLIAETAAEAASLDQVRFVPNAKSPLKPNGPIASGKQRLEMTGLAISGNSRFEVDDIEIRREGTSYTVDTLQQLVSLHADWDLFLIIGADSLEQFSKWREPRRICELAIPLVVARAGHEANIERLAEFVTKSRMEEIRAATFRFPLIEISSTDLRRRVAESRSIRYRTPRAVEAYIEHAGLYQGTAMERPRG